MTKANITFGEKDSPLHDDRLMVKTIDVSVYVDNLLIGFISIPEDLEGKNEKESCVFCLGPSADEFRGFKSHSIEGMKELVKKTLLNSDDKFHDSLWTDIVKNWTSREKEWEYYINALQHEVLADTKNKSLAKQLESEMKFKKSMKKAIGKYSTRQKEID